MKFYGELLVFILLFITNFRVFFVKSARHDPLVVLAPATFIIALLQIFSFGIEVFTALGFIIALLVLLSNFHAIFRYSENLYVDHYSPLMMIWAIVTSLLSAIAIVGIVIFAPLELNNASLNINESQYRLEGNFRSGFSKAPFYTSADAFVYKFEPVNKEENAEDERVILFFPDKRGDTEHYKPYLKLLASKGFTVYSADFFADDCKWLHTIEDIKILRRIAFVIRGELKPAFFASQREYYSYNISLEINAMLNLLQEKYGPDKAYYFVSDSMGNTAINDLLIKQKSKVKGSFFLNTIPDFTSSGYGFIKQTDPILARYKGLKKDNYFTEAKLMAEKTLEKFPPEIKESEETESPEAGEDGKESEAVNEEAAK
ncbi:MAG: hypothetical protein K5681_09390 [Treponema sp.]|nr:hypothetical protein [Treponema sp.]